MLRATMPRARHVPQDGAGHGAAPSVTPRQPPPTVDVEAPPLAKAEEADGDASPKNVASVPASDERAPTVAFAAPLCVEPPPASVAV